MEECSETLNRNNIFGDMTHFTTHYAESRH